VPRDERRPGSHRAPATTKDIDSIARARREVREMRSMRRWHFYWKRRFPERLPTAADIRLSLVLVPASVDTRNAGGPLGHRWREP
jgi:hypothetical protein